jgi:ABC-type sugar transport system ATPase subunit
MNFLPVTAAWDGGSLELRHESLRVRTGAGVPADLQGRLADGAAAWIGVRPEDVEIVDPGTNAVDATVWVTEPLGGETVVDLHVADRVVKVLAPATIAAEHDQAVGVLFDPKRLHLFDEAGTALISAGGSDAFSVEAIRAG